SRIRTGLLKLRVELMALGVAVLLVGLGSGLALRSFNAQLGYDRDERALALVNGLLFQPVRRRIQHVLDRRVRRQSYDAARALAAFQTSLRQDEVELEALARRLLGTVREVLHPARMGLWLRDRDQD